MNIFRADPSHSEILTALDQSRAFSAHWTLQGWQEELAQATSRVWCAQQNEQIVGFIALRGACGQYEILNLAVAAAQSRQGIGRALVNYALGELVRQGAQQISLEVSAKNQPAQELYRKMGFNVVGVRKKFYVDGADAVVMEKKL